MVNMNGKSVDDEKSAKKNAQIRQMATSRAGNAALAVCFSSSPLGVYHDRKRGVVDVEAGRFVEPKWLAKGATGRVRGKKLNG
jgi:hypothetical protein